MPLSEFALVGILPMKDCGDMMEKIIPFIKKKRSDHQHAIHLQRRTRLRLSDTQSSKSIQTSSVPSAAPIMEPINDRDDQQGLKQQHESILSQPMFLHSPITIPLV